MNVPLKEDVYGGNIIVLDIPALPSTCDEVDWYCSEGLKLGEQFNFVLCH